MLFRLILFQILWEILELMVVKALDALHVDRIIEERLSYNTVLVGIN